MEKLVSNRERYYFLDWIRILVFIVLIFYHTAMIFVDWSFHIESGYNNDFLKYLMILSSQWRLDILFLISGVAVFLMIQKVSISKFFLQRITRLYLPLVFSIVLVVALQSYYEALHKNVFVGSFWNFWSELYFSFSWDKRMNAPFPTYNHMWYVLYLFHYSILLIPFLMLLKSNVCKKTILIVEGFLIEKYRLIWIPPFLYFMIYFSFENHKINHTFYDDWYAHALFLFTMALGAFIAKMPKIWMAFEKIKYLSLLVALLSYFFLLVLYLFQKELGGISVDIFWGIITIMVKWSWISMIIGFSAKFLNFKNNLLIYLNELIYPLFILHQTIIIIIAYYVLKTSTSLLFQYILISLGTVFVCFVLFELLIKRLNFMRFLFGLKSI